MSSVQENLENLSLRLSEVLDDVGVNDDIVMKRRTRALFWESTEVISSLATDGVTCSRAFNFGSQSEGSTTIGINSDVDGLASQGSHHVIPDWAEWKHGVTNVLMVQDESIAPGYCLLQRLRDDAPLAVNYVPDDVYFMDAKGRVLLKNSVFDAIFRDLGIERHGPAGNSPEGGNMKESDYVLAFPCSQWPSEGRCWLNRRSRSGWPSARLKSECENSGCFLVPVGSKISGLDELEWRISTSLAERYLMFSLNITQLRCYILLKMLLKSFPVFHNVISSYMCKTILFHCIENADPEYWQEPNLICCINYILHILYNCIHLINCPHFIIPGNNLMARRISPEQQHNLLAVIQQIINSNGRVFVEINIDNVGERLQMKLNRILVYPHNVRSASHIRKFISGEQCFRAAHHINAPYCGLMGLNINNNVQDALQYFVSGYVRCNQQIPSLISFEQKAYGYITPLLCSTIGSLLASYYTTINQPLTDDVVTWLKLGMNSDVSSGLLKLATVCYSFGHTNVTEEILRRVDRQYDRNVVNPVCGCHSDMGFICKQGFRDAADQIQVTDFRHIVSYCVRFMPCEINIVPEEMRQEYTRSSPEDIQSRGIHDGWMDLAVIDSLHYLYFLQYKTYGRLRNHREQLTALRNLHKAIRDEINLSHNETAFNLLGQCMEQENLPNDAFHYYERSLQVRPRNNAANFHMSRLLNR